MTAETSSLDIPPEVAEAAGRAPLYGGRRFDGGARAGTALADWRPHDHLTLTEAGDPFGGRQVPDTDYSVITQASQDAALYWTLGRRELDAAAQVLAGCWRSLGVVAGDRVVVYDFGSSPVALFASRHFQPYLRRGAAELTGSVPICNDGLPELAPRTVHLATYVQPRLTFVGRHALDPLRRALEESSDARAPIHVVVSSDEEPLGTGGLRSASSEVFGSLTELLRIDLGLLLAPPCPLDPDAFHPDPDAYRVEVQTDDGEITDRSGRTGRLVVTNRFLTTCPVIRYVSSVYASFGPGVCDCGAPRTVRLAT